MEFCASTFRNLISNKSGILINKNLCKVLGFELAFLLSDLADRDEYFESRNPNYDGWFFSTMEKRCEELGMNVRTMRTIMQKAKNQNLIETKMKGQPAKQFISVNYKLMYEKLLTCHPRVTKTQGLKKTPVNIEPNVENLNDSQGDESARSRVTKTQGHNHTTDNLTKKNIYICGEHLKIISSLEQFNSTFYPNTKLAPNHTVQWDKELHLLFKRWLHSPKELYSMLKIYRDNYNDKSTFPPEIRSMKTLREKIDMLETFCERVKRKGITSTSFNSDKEHQLQLALHPSTTKAKSTKFAHLKPDVICNNNKEA